MCIIIVFAHPMIRKKAYKFFWFTHSLYVLLYALSLIHGLARLTGAPRFWMFFIGPGIVFTLDKVGRIATTLNIFLDFRKCNCSNPLNQSHCSNALNIPTVAPFFSWVVKPIKIMWWRHL